jgi:DNA topoisomerase-1
MPKKTGYKLVIVESPTKARTIGSFVGKEYKVESSFGHIRDLPKSKLGVDVEKEFEPSYIIPIKARKNASALKKLAEKAEEIVLATDEDREGEAIAWHLKEILKGADKDKKFSRIVFHEITKTAIEKALENPREINLEMVDAQQARRILDRIVGYKLSPFLWKKVVRGLSAGRVQSVALRLIVEREEEIKAFKAEEYWTLGAKLKAKKGEFEARLTKMGNVPVEKFSFQNTDSAETVSNDLKQAEYSVSSVTSKETQKHPLAPFTTSTLQQEANKRFRLSAKQTMMLAQRLYENGQITYMRTDSVNLSEESLVAASKLIAESFGKEYQLPEPRKFKTKSRIAQEAHEAVRPTNPFLKPQAFGGPGVGEDKAQEKLYELIWKRFVASQMPSAKFLATVAEVSAKGEENYELRANGSQLVFDGFLKVWTQPASENNLPEIKEGEKLELKELIKEQHFTEPPARYNEASLIKVLEENGIGRPSTYAPTIATITARRYVEKNQDRRFQPTEMGELVTKVLKEHFPQIVDSQFTADMEENLDKIAEGKKNWRHVLADFYNPFAKLLEIKYSEVSKEEISPDETTDEKCDKCGKPMIIKRGRFGKFLACTGFPDCKNTKSIAIVREPLGKCPKCGEGNVVQKKTKKGRFFFGCDKYPACDFASWKRPGTETKVEESKKEEDAEDNSETHEEENPLVNKMDKGDFDGVERLEGEEGGE